MVFTLVACSNDKTKTPIDTNNSVNSQENVTPENNTDVIEDNAQEQTPEDENKIAKYESEQLKLFSDTRLKYHILQGAIDNILVDSYGLNSVYANGMIFESTPRASASQDFDVFDIGKGTLKLFGDWKYLIVDENGNEKYYEAYDGQEMTIEVNAAGNITKDVKIRYMDVKTPDTHSLVKGFTNNKSAVGTYEIKDGALYCSGGSKTYTFEIPDEYSVDDIDDISVGKATLIKMKDGKYYTISNNDFLGHDANTPITMTAVEFLNSQSEHVLEAYETEEYFLVLMDDHCLYELII